MAQRTLRALLVPAVGLSVTSLAALADYLSLPLPKVAGVLTLLAWPVAPLASGAWLALHFTRRRTTHWSDILAVVVATVAVLLDIALLPHVFASLAASR